MKGSGLVTSASRITDVQQTLWGFVQLEHEDLWQEFQASMVSNFRQCCHLKVHAACI